MASRTVRCIFKNLTGSTLSLVSENLEHGIYTDPWTPPASIGPKGVGEWRTESDGFMTGTEGRCRYSISVGMGTEFVDLWWDNPFIGSNGSSISIVEDFTGANSKDLEGANHIDGSPPPNLEKMKEGDVEAWIDAILFPPYIFANASSANDANAIFAVRQKGQVSSPLFGPQGTGPRTYKINKSRNSDDWEGLWASGAVSLTIADVGGGLLSATITDTTANPDLNFQENFRLGSVGWAINAFTLAMKREFAGADSVTASALIRAAAKRVVAREVEGQERVADLIRHSVRSELQEYGVHAPGPKIDRAIKSAAAVSQLHRGTVMLSHGVCLTLYDEYESGQKVGSDILYERVAPSAFGAVLASERLTFHPMLH
jgi:hypothetical protein